MFNMSGQIQLNLILLNCIFRTRFRIDNVKPQNGFRKKMEFPSNGLRFKDFDF